MSDVVAATAFRPIPDLDQEHEPPEPSADPQDLNQILDDLVTAKKKHIIFPIQSSYVALALWTVCTHVIQALSVAPYLMIMSPQPACGKTRVFEVLEHLVRNSLRAANMSLSTMFRVIESECPTLLLDEFDNLDLKERKEMLQLLNMGHRRGEKFFRTEPKTLKVQRFDVFGPKIFASLAKEYPPALESRCIDIVIDRRKPGQPLEEWNSRRVARELRELHSRIQRWAADNMEEFYWQHVVKEPEVPDELGDREKDLWRPLFGIADMASEKVGSVGPTWAHTARLASKELRHERVNTAEDHALRLLTDLQSIFIEPKNSDRLSTADIVQSLNDNELLRWSGWNHDKGMRPRDVGKLLGQFRIKSKQLKIDGKNKMGYAYDDCRNAFELYCRVDPTDPTSEEPDHVIPF